MVPARTLHTANLYQMATLALASLFCMVWWPHGLQGLLMGGLLMVGNLSVAQFLVRKVINQGRPQPLYLVALSLKFVALLGLVAFLLYTFKPDILAFALGLCCYFIGIALALTVPGTFAPAPARAAPTEVKQ